jgi:hypothetical protein
VLGGGRSWPVSLGVDLPLPAAVAAYYRSLFLNVTLPGGIVGDVHRGVSHGRDVSDVGRVAGRRWERFAGQVVQVLLTVVVLLALPSPVHSSMPLVAIAVVVATSLRHARGSGATRWRSSAWAQVRAQRPATSARAPRPQGVAGHRARISLVVCGHAVTFLIAARTTRHHRASVPDAAAGAARDAGHGAAQRRWLGAARGATAWAFSSAGLGAEQGVATAVVYGVMVFVASLPGAAVLVVSWSRRIRPPERTEPRLPEEAAHA